MSVKTFSEQEKQELKNKYQTTGLRELAREFKTNVLRVREVLADMGVAIRGRGRPSLTVPRKGEIHLVTDDDNNDNLVSNDNVDLDEELQDSSDDSDDEEVFRVD